MSLLRVMLAGMVLTAPIWATGAIVEAPSYTAAGIVNAASYSAGALAPNVIASIYGTHLSFNTVGLFGNSHAGLPTTIGGVTVYVGGIAAGLYYVSPNQINFLIPNAFNPNKVDVAVAREGVAGPHVMVTLDTTGPALFQDANNTAIATHLDNSLVSDSAPGHPGEWVILYGTGLGRTIPDALNYTPANTASPLQNIGAFTVLLNGAAVGAADIYYAGLAPGFAGLYQVNLKLPQGAGPNPEIRLETGTILSVPGVHLPVSLEPSSP